mgnify:CR=1 FL=1
MTGLILKDIINLKKYIKQLGLVLVAFTFIGISLKSPSYIIFMMILFTTMMTVTSMAYDESTKWDKYALTMPISRKDLAKSKYVLLVIFALSGGIISLILGFIISKVTGVGDYKELLLTSGSVSLVSLVLVGILLPIIFKLGTEKARIIMLIIFILPTILITGFSKLIRLFKGLSIPQPTEEQIRYLCYASPFIVLLILFISYRLSVGILNKKDF